MSFTIQLLKISLKKTLTKASVIFAVAFVGAFALLFALNLYKSPKLTVSVVLEDDSQMSQMIAEEILKNQAVSEKIDVEIVEEEKYAKGKAVIILPRGFYQSIMNGENLSPRVKLKGLTTVESAYLQSIGEAMESYLAQGQSAVYSYIDALRERETETKSLNLKIMGINALYLNQFTDRMNFIEGRKLSNDFNSIFAAFVASAAFFMIFTLDKSVSDGLKLKNMLKIRGGSERHTFGIVLFSLFILCLFLLLPLKILGMKINITVSAFVLALAAIIIELLATTEGEKVFYLSLFLGISLFLSGMIIPLEILPKRVSELGFLSPFYYFKPSDNFIEAKALILFAFLLFLAFYLWGKEDVNEKFFENIGH